MNPRLGALHTYPFEKLRADCWRARAAPAHLPHIALSIGEPQHDPPRVRARGAAAGREPPGRLSGHGAGRWNCAAARRAGSSGASACGRRASIRRPWCCRSTARARRCSRWCRRRSIPASAPLVITPNPFYQIYEGAALLAGADALLPRTRPPRRTSCPIWRRCRRRCWSAARCCSCAAPAIPTGAVLHENFLARALDLAERHDFIVAADECYAEILPRRGRAAARACSRSRRRPAAIASSAAWCSTASPSARACPGLRSGFVAGDPELMRKFLLYRTYQGGAMSPMPRSWPASRPGTMTPTCGVNRRLYQEKFERVLPILSPVLDVQRPDGAFYLWVDIDGDDERFTRELFTHARMSRCCRAATWDAPPNRATRARDACACR